MIPKLIKGDISMKVLQRKYSLICTYEDQRYTLTQFNSKKEANLCMESLDGIKSNINKLRLRFVQSGFKIPQIFMTDQYKNVDPSKIRFYVEKTDQKRQ